MGIFVGSQAIALLMQKGALQGAKIPHRVSMPVLRNQDGGYCLAAFIFTFTREELESGRIHRPTYWMTADIQTGEDIKEYSCKERDFSDEPFDSLYFVKEQSQVPLTKEYYAETYALLDQVRKALIAGHPLPKEQYAAYLDRVLETIPTAYRLFYAQLSIAT